MKIVRGNLRIEPELYGAIRLAVGLTHERLIKADLATPEMRDYLDGVRIILSMRMVSSAGQANWHKQYIKLNVRLLAIYPERLEETLAHEVAHVLSGKFFNDYGHGDGWKQIMVRLGFKPERCHNLDVSPLRPPETIESVFKRFYPIDISS